MCCWSPTVAWTSVIAEAGVTLIGYRPLRDAMRHALRRRPVGAPGPADVPVHLGDHRYPEGPSMGVDVAEGDEPESQDRAADRRRSPVGPDPRSMRLDGLVLLDPPATNRWPSSALFADDGIGVDPRPGRAAPGPALGVADRPRRRAVGAVG